MDDYGRIRRAHRDGLSIREIARTFHHSRRKIREVLHGEGQPQQYSQRQTQAAPRLGPFHETIRQILADDESNHPNSGTQHNGSLSDCGTSTAISAVTMRFVDSCGSTEPINVKHSFRLITNRASGWKRTSARFMSIFPTDGDRFQC